MRTMCGIRLLVGIAAATSPGPLNAAATFDCGGTCYLVSTNTGQGSQSDNDSELDGVTSISSSIDIDGQGHYFHGYAAADLAQGSTRAFVDTVGGGGSTANFYEVLKFDLPEGMTGAEAIVTWTLEGTTSIGFASSSNAAANFSITAATSGMGVEFFDLYYGSASPLYEQFNSDGQHSFTFSAPLALNETDLYRVNSVLSLGISGSGRLDYGNTAFFNIVLPQGVSIISSSEALLSDPISSAVPEPATWAMMIVGFGFVGAALRQRRRVSVRYG